MSAMLQRDLRQQIEQMREELLSLIDRHALAPTYRMRFEHLWSDLSIELGWAGRGITRLDLVKARISKLLRRESVWVPGTSPVIWSEADDLEFSPRHVYCPTIFGFKVFVNSFDDHRYISKGSNAWEAATTTLFLRLLASTDYVIDIGANVGFYSMLGAVAKPGMKIAAFEPARENNISLRKGVEASGLADRVVISTAAISAEDGDADLFRTPLGSGGYSLHCSGAHAGGGSERVKTTTLDRAVAQLGFTGRGLVKIDIEGAEEDALHGAAALLASSAPPVLLFESNDAPDRIAAGLRSRNYEIFRVLEARPRRPLLEQFGKAYAEHCNYLALPRGAPESFASLGAPIDPRDFSSSAVLLRMAAFLKRSIETWRSELHGPGDQAHGITAPIGASPRALVVGENLGGSATPRRSPAHRPAASLARDENWYAEGAVLSR